MILIADSGSTKTDWRLINLTNKKQTSFTTIGFNPYFINEEGIVKKLASSLLIEHIQKITVVYFYGAGCSSVEKNKIVWSALNTFFKHTEKIVVGHDLLAAARAVSGNKPSLVAILGTGANTCLYDGEIIKENVPALGYLLGDEGSGAHLGKNFINQYLLNQLPNEINFAFQKAYPTYSLNSILEAVYKQPLPNRFLAQFSHFIYLHKDNEAIKKLINECLTAFFEKYVIRYSNYNQYNLNLVGSVAFNYQSFILHLATKYNVTIGKIIEKPIDGLVEYHLNH